MNLENYTIKELEDLSNKIKDEIIDRKRRDVEINIGDIFIGKDLCNIYLLRVENLITTGNGIEIEAKLINVDFENHSIYTYDDDFEYPIVGYDRIPSHLCKVVDNLFSEILEDEKPMLLDKIKDINEKFFEKHEIRFRDLIERLR